MPVAPNVTAGGVALAAGMRTAAVFVPSQPAWTFFRINFAAKNRAPTVPFYDKREKQALPLTARLS